MTIRVTDLVFSELCIDSLLTNSLITLFGVSKVLDLNSALILPSGRTDPIVSRTPRTIYEYKRY